MPQPILIFVVPLLILTAAAVTATAYFLSLRREVCSLRRRVAVLDAAARDAFIDIEDRLRDVYERLRLAEDRPASVTAAARGGLNLNNRAQALRMLRRGMAPENIAVSLNLPRPEIELLIRVQELSAASGGPISETPGG